MKADYIWFMYSSRVQRQHNNDTRTGHDGELYGAQEPYFHSLNEIWLGSTPQSSTYLRMASAKQNVWQIVPLSLVWGRRGHHCLFTEGGCIHTCSNVSVTIADIKQYKLHPLQPQHWTLHNPHLECTKSSLDWVHGIPFVRLLALRLYPEYPSLPHSSH